MLTRRRRTTAGHPLTLHVTVHMSAEICLMVNIAILLSDEAAQTRKPPFQTIPSGEDLGGTCSLCVRLIFVRSASYPLHERFRDDRSSHTGQRPSRPAPGLFSHTRNADFPPPIRAPDLLFPTDGVETSMEIMAERPCIIRDGGRVRGGSPCVHAIRVSLKYRSSPGCRQRCKRPQIACMALRKPSIAALDRALSSSCGK